MQSNMIFPDMEIPHRLQVTMQIPSKLSFHLEKTGTYKREVIPPKQ